MPVQELVIHSSKQLAKAVQAIAEFLVSLMMIITMFVNCKMFFH
jgi:hypothetical protein